MSADDKEQTMVKGLECGAVYFMRKPVRQDDLKNVWQYAIPKRRHEASSQIVIEDSKVLGSNSSSSEPDQAGAANSVRIPTHGHTPSNADTTSRSVPDKYYEEVVPKRKLTNSKRKVKSSNVGQGLSNNLVKKQKVAWSTELHNKFLDSLKIIGLDRAVPKKILEVMNVPGLTRENIASHLQKYRIFLKRVADVTETPDGMGLRMGSRVYRSNSATSYSQLYYGFQLEHLEITDENLLRKMLKQELRAIRDPLYRGPSSRYQGPPTLSGTMRTPFKSIYSSFAFEPRDYLNKQMPIIFGERLMGADSYRLTSFGSNEIMQQAAAPAPAPAQSSELVQFGMYTTGSRLHTSGLVNDIEAQGGTIDMGTSYDMETENGQVMPQVTYCNAAMQQLENGPSQQVLLQPDVHDSISDLSTSNLDISGFQGDFSGFLVNQLNGGDETFNYLEEAGNDVVGYPYFGYGSNYSAHDNQSKNQESAPILNQQFGDGVSLIQTSHGDYPYFDDDFFPWSDHEPFQSQPGDQNANMLMVDERDASGCNKVVAGPLINGSSKWTNHLRTD
uniref:Uncharacterized protein n=1 Tax=Kalanchoe fedtschenkoi TaxID=63787 RepID=A0A7N1A8L9_KALFE